MSDATVGDDPLALFCRSVRARSQENGAAVAQLHPLKSHGTIMSILRQELDSMVRVIYLLSIVDRRRRLRLIEDFVAGAQWTRATGGRVTDREMVDLAGRLHSWTGSVYKFGCAFIHLSCYHDYDNRDPLSLVEREEQEAILSHMRHYHGGPSGPNPTFEELSTYFPDVFRKVSSNLEHYIIQLEEDGELSSGDLRGT